MTSPDRAKLKMHRERSVLDEAPAYLASGLIAHVGIADAQGPVVIPMTYHYDPATPRKLYLHGAHQSRIMQAVASGENICVAVTQVDGLVYSKTAMDHSVNYRSVVCFCRAAADQGTQDDQRHALEAMIGRYFPGRTVGKDYDVIPVKHLETTMFVTLDIVDWSAKRRVGPANGPVDDDPAVPGTAGVIELRNGAAG
jgi:nitroimidazol reductase NimA-like FMN-containing flavoprotein (pyridoxamine 5'-phosphate oxidase superfamily)